MKINWNEVAAEFIEPIYKLDNNEYIDLSGNTHSDYETAIRCNRDIIAEINNKELFIDRVHTTEEGFASVGNDKEFQDGADAMIYLMKEYLVKKEK